MTHALEGAGHLRSIRSGLAAEQGRESEAAPSGEPHLRLQAIPHESHANGASHEIQSEIARLRAELDLFKRAKNILDMEAVELRALLSDAEQQLGRVTQTVSYRLGHTLVAGFKSPKALVRLPPKLFALYRERNSMRRRAGQGDRAVPSAARTNEITPLVGEIAEIVARSGPRAAAHRVRSLELGPHARSQLLLETAKEARHGDIAYAAELAREAQEFNPSDPGLKRLAFSLAEMGAVAAPAALIRGVLQSGETLSAGERRLAHEILAVEDVLGRPPEFPSRQENRSDRMGRAILVSGNALGEIWSMTALRVHATASLYRTRGEKVLVAVLPRASMSPLVQMSRESLSFVEGIAYHRVQATSPSGELSRAYFEEAARAVCELARGHGADRIEADASILEGTVALRAGRALGIPVVLHYVGDDGFQLPTEVRSDECERLLLSRKYQAALLAAADDVILHEPLAEKCPGSDMSDSRVRWLGPVQVNSGPRRLTEVSSVATREIVIGVVGDDSSAFDCAPIAELVATLSMQSIPVGVRVVLAGSGRSFEAAIDGFSRRGLESQLTILRRPLPEELWSSIAGIDLLVIPLGRDQCELVRSCFEMSCALSLGVPVLVPNCASARRWIEDGLPIRAFERFNGGGFVHVAGELIRDPAALAAAQAAALEWARARSDRPEPPIPSRGLRTGSTG